MLRLPRWRVILVIIVSVLGVLFALPNLVPDNVRQRIPAWLPHQTLNLGLDLQGGSHLLLEVDTATLFVRPLSNGFIDDYLDAEWPAIAGCVGCFRIEGLGAQLFARIDGSHFTVLGMPLLPVLDYLRVRGVLAS